MLALPSSLQDYRFLLPRVKKSGQNSSDPVASFKNNWRTVFWSMPFPHFAHCPSCCLEWAVTAGGPVSCICRFGHQLRRKSACSPESAGIYQVGIAACLSLLGCFLWSWQLGKWVMGGISWPTGWQSTTAFHCFWVPWMFLVKQGVVLSELYMPACWVRLFVNSFLKNKY